MLKPARAAANWCGMSSSCAVRGSSRFEDYCVQLGSVLGHLDRVAPLRAYLAGLLLPGERKSVEPMAAKIDPQHVGARHQSMHHFVATAPWDERALLEAAREYALSGLERHAPVAAWVVDDTGLPKKGTASVGVARQYCGPKGKTDNCQVAVMVSVCNATMSVPCCWRLYLPEEWAQDKQRREAAFVPVELKFATKWQIALQEIEGLLEADLPRAPVIADAGYGAATEFRDGLRERGLLYAVGVLPDTSVWPQGQHPLPPRAKPRTGRPPTNLRRDAQHQPSAVKELALALPKQAWKMVRWREGTKGKMESRFACVRVRPAHRDYKRQVPREEEWLVIEWPTSEREPTKYTLSSLPRSATPEDLVRLIKLRWRVERDYQELKDELGIDHFEGRGWRGFHHHGALCIAAYAFLVAERARLSPPAPLAFLKAARVPKGFRARGSPDAA